MLHLLMVLLLMGDAQAHAQAKSYNTDLFEKEDSGETQDKSQSFTAKVKVVREESDGVEVFFEGTSKVKGGYMLLRSTEQYAKLLKLLESSKKPKGPSVSVTVNADKHIKKVEKKEGGGGIVVPDDPNKMWDYGKIPD
ncbi:hypothetical protein [Bdellovibrio reynosensis]|uniref:Uncharacterized protein n=1 Tax=Bdellovibrio reynosensis TaxID=2835041 RepID=A0ABY4CA18_9BACT|nr:hypothetical protein [Bdellovibrio reynosensis]UOF01584.1 hypothetical protein MNR06_01280 [Bdellovibrio reynosensis]